VTRRCVDGAWARRWRHQRKIAGAFAGKQFSLNGRPATLVGMTGLWYRGGAAYRACAWRAISSNRISIAASVSVRLSRTGAAAERINVVLTLKEKEPAILYRATLRTLLLTATCDMLVA